MTINKKRFIFGLEALVILGLALTTFGLIFKHSKEEVVEEKPPEPTMLYDMVVDSFNLTEAEIGKNEFLSDILLKYNVSYAKIGELAAKSKDVFDVRKLRKGKKYTILSDTDSLNTAQYFIYDPSPYFYVIYDLRDTLNVTKVEREITKERKVGSGVIYSSLWNAIVDNDMPIDIAVAMEDIFGYSVDFHHVKKGDQFKLIFEEHFIEGESVGIGKVSGAMFKHHDIDYYGFYFEVDSINKDGYYFDEKARPLKKAFLKAPVKFSRISSPFNRRRFHPVLRRVKPHLGTDYAAPRGTPIYAVSGGTVIAASYTRGNGKYVKIKHDKVYSTQYLHMSRFAKGIRKGTRVKQGQVIGYVGSTGLATGPHVCFRFWKNGKQVNHRRLKLPPPKPMPEKYIPAFEVVRDSMTEQLATIDFLSEEEIKATQEEIEADTLEEERPKEEVTP